MPVVRFKFSSVDATLTNGVITLWSPRLRPGGLAAITSEKRESLLVNGEAELDLEPGPVVGHVTGDGATHQLKFTVPSLDETVEFLDLLEGGYAYEPEIVQAAQQSARESRRWAEASEESYQSSKALYGDLSAVNAARAASEAARDSSRSARDVAITKRDEAEGFAGSASDDADRAEAAADTAAADAEELLAQHVTDSRAARDAAAGSASDASSSANGAADSAAASAGSAADAVVARQGAEAAQGEAEARSEFAATQADDASEYADAAALSSTAAADSAILAGKSAAAADVSAGNAQDAADEAADDVRATLQGYVTSATESKDAAKTSETNAAASEDSARQSAADAAEAVASGVADATADSKGKLRLAGDLGGTADAPTVPELADKSDKTHSHTSSQVDGLDPIIATVNAATYQPEASTLMRRTSSGRVSVAAPSEAANAANKQYVDQAVLTKVDSTSTATRLYGTNASGDQDQIKYSSTTEASSIPLRKSGGEIEVASPTVDADATNKLYVDSSITAAIEGVDTQIVGTVVGELLWSGTMYSPATGFTRLRSTSDGRLVSSRSQGVEVVSDSGANDAYIVVPKDGLYFVEAFQLFENSDSGNRGCGLTTSSSSATTGQVAWFNTSWGSVAGGCKTALLRAGQKIYPWVFIGSGGAQMTGYYRGDHSKYSITLIY